MFDSSPLLGGSPHPLGRRRLLFRRSRILLRDESGASTAEYALVVLAAVAFAGVLIAVIRSDFVRALLEELIRGALSTG